MKQHKAFHSTGIRNHSTKDKRVPNKNTSTDSKKNETCKLNMNLEKSIRAKRNILSGHSASVGSSQDSPAAFRGMAFFLASALCSISLFASAAFTLSRASGVIVCASLWNNCCAYSTSQSWSIFSVTVSGFFK